MEYINYLYYKMQIFTKPFDRTIAIHTDSNENLYQLTVKISRKLNYDDIIDSKQKINLFKIIINLSSFNEHFHLINNHFLEHSKS